MSTVVMSLVHARANWLPRLVLGLAGALIIGLAGFSPGFAHQAAHDLRHTMAFPCH